ncbi:carboxylating nicotinate-nucleotide diphosphorylase [Desertibacillus haloalkaliphilus]|uniref:carboxylating nicotinate-nucleotide diphosphorylase n=1 Tax=Desertibacillus haloalkaliphilus TaxID=1328930 RepID=UPI001C276DB4|nr:carboxylating nicotinate-nucleotide diphosphorylase [Desertibacillus haloalkaliphilus]MBU8905486.1 carboxylating nicotinate-nucleotide diphosphorylase [Desertibacillus haloalkaliphilus]
MNPIKVREQLKQFFIEDLGEGDLTSQTVFTNDHVGSGTFVVKSDGIISGVEVIRQAYALFNEDIDVSLYVRDGAEVRHGDVIATVHGPMVDLLSAERVVLNLVQRMSGVATLTNKAVAILGSSHTRICDTRKTTPGLRMFEKYAVRCGGGYNHRLGLYDGVMIKDNHIAACGGITAAVRRVKDQLGHMVKVEVETETREEVIEAVEAKADIIMFDNRSPDEVREFVELVPGSISTEVSGGIDLATVADYRDTFVDYLSLGFLTHSARALDISFNVQGGSKS